MKQEASNEKVTTAHELEERSTDLVDMISPSLLGLLIILALTIFVSLSIVIVGLRNGITPMPSSREAVELMVKAAEEELRRLYPSLNEPSQSPGGQCPLTGKPGAGRNSSEPSPLIIEAGSGWGGPALALAFRLPYARIVGYENSPLPFLFSLLRTRIVGTKKMSNLRFVYGDLFAPHVRRSPDLASPRRHRPQSLEKSFLPESDPWQAGPHRGESASHASPTGLRIAESTPLTEADVIVCYLHPDGMQKLGELIRSGTRPPRPAPHDTTDDNRPASHATTHEHESTSRGTTHNKSTPPIVISNTFSLPGEQPVRTLQASDSKRSPIYVYYPHFLLKKV